MKSWLSGLALMGCVAGAAAQTAQRSGYADMGPAVQAMQRDADANPAMLWLQDGQLLWGRAPSAQSKSCAACHGEVTALRGVAARYPAWDEALGRPVNLATRINQCRQRHQGQAAWLAEHPEWLGLEALVGRQSLGLPIAPPADARLEPFRRRGQALFGQRIGQLNLSCANCHDTWAGGRLAGVPIPQGQATGYPLYRLEWQALGSLSRRIRNCMTGVRAEPLAPHGLDMVELELHLARRAMGMAVETPGVRP
jgi:sulfur-oxidizing protein SoxA